MTTRNMSYSPLAPFRQLWQNPIAAGAVMIIYVIGVFFVLSNLDRTSSWFPLHTMLAFPLLVFAPFLVLSAPIPNIPKGIALFLILGVGIPIIGIFDSTYLDLMIQICIFAALALGLNIVVGFAGLLDLGYVAFFAVGAYLWGMFTSAGNTTSKTVIDAAGALVPRSGFITIAPVNVPILMLILLIALGVALPFIGRALKLRITTGVIIVYAVLAIIVTYLWAGSNAAAASNVPLGVIITPAIPLPVQAFYIFLFIGVVFAALGGIALGLPVLRLRGDYLAIVTLGFGEMIRVLVNNLNQPVNFTNGPQGLPGVAAPGADFLIPHVTNAASWLQTKPSSIDFVSQLLLFYFLGLAIVGVSIMIANRLDNSPIGRAWTAIREDEVAAIAMGVPLVRMKLMAFAMGAAFAGAIGVLYAAKQTFVSPESFTLVYSINILAMVIVGGLGSIQGVIFGAAVVTLLNLHILKQFGLLINSLGNIKYVVPIINFPIADWPDQLRPEKYERFIFGILLVVMMIFRPEGLLPSRRRKMELHRDEEADVPELKEAETDVA